MHFVYVIIYYLLMLFYLFPKTITNIRLPQQIIHNFAHTILTPNCTLFEPFLLALYVILTAICFHNKTCLRLRSPFAYGYLLRAVFCLKYY